MREVGLHTMYKMVLLAAMAVAASFAPQGSSQPATPGMTLDDSARGEFESSEGRRKLSHVDVTEAGEPCAPNPLRSRVVDLDSYDFGCREIEKMLQENTTLVGSGQVRDVFLSEYNGQQLVVKTLRDAEGLYLQRVFLDRHNREVQVLDAMKGHRNVVSMLGVCDTAMATEYYPMTLLGIICRGKTHLPIQRIVAMALDAARGLQALHELAVSIHVDMKPQQLLIDDNGRVMLNDFNNAHIMSVAGDGTLCPSKSARRRRLTPWPAPENYEGKPLTPAADVYSMGMILFSLMAGDLPYEGDEDRLRMALEAGSRPEIDVSWHKGYMQVVQDMWNDDPLQRPSAREVVSRLQSIQMELTDEGVAGGSY